MKFKANKKTLGSLFLALLIVLIFCSKTIYGHNLPEIMAVKPQNGTLKKLEISSAIAAWAEIEPVYLKVGGICEEVLVKEGEMVEAGQVLLHMDFDTVRVEEYLQELAISRAKVELDIKNIQLSLDKLAITSGPEGYQSQNFAKEIRQAQRDLADGELLFELGGISQRELMAAQDALENLYAKESQAMAEHGLEAAALQLALAGKRLELENLSLQEQPYRRLLADYEAYGKIIAPVRGQLLSLNIAKGEHVPENTLLAEIGMGEEFVVECMLPLENDFVRVGDTCQLSNASHVFQGFVRGIKPQKEGKAVRVIVAAEEISAGETFDILFEKESNTTYTLVPNGALNRDNEGYFLYQVKRRQGILGKEYYLERLNVYIGDGDNQNTAIIKGITFFEPLLLTSDQAVSGGDMVKLINEGDFFED